MMGQDSVGPWLWLGRGAEERVIDWYGQPMRGPTTANMRIETLGLALLVFGACCPIGWHGVGVGLVGLALLAGRSLWEQLLQRRLAAPPWLLATLLAWCGLSLLTMAPERRFGALREWLQWTCLLAGGWCAGRGVGKKAWQRFGGLMAVGFLVSLAVGLWQSFWPGTATGLVALLHGAPYAEGGSGPSLAEELVVGLQRSHLQYCVVICLTLPFALVWRRCYRRRLALIALAAWTVYPLPFLVFLAAIATLLVISSTVQEREWLIRFAAIGMVGLVVGLRDGPSCLDWVRPSVRSAEGMQPKRLTVEHAAAARALPTRPLGFGPGTYRESVRRARIEADLPKPTQDRVRRDGNGQYLVLAVETGAAGAALFLAFLALAAWRATGTEKVALVVLIGVAFCTGTLVQGLGPLAGFLLGRAWLGRETGGWQRLLGQVLLLGLALGIGLAWPYQEPVADVPTADLPATRERIWTEAEETQAVHAGWRIEPEADAGGNAVLCVPLGVGKRVGKASYQLVSPAAGHWKLWLRVRWSGGCANSILASVDGSPPVSVEDAIFGRWHWVDVHPKHTFVLPEGEFELVLSNSEDDVAVDQIAFLPDPKDMPVGILEAAGSAESKPEPATAPAQAWDFDEEAAPSDRSFNKYDD